MKRTIPVRQPFGIDGTSIEDEAIWIQMPSEFKGTYLMGDSADARIFNRLVARKVVKQLDRCKRGEAFARKWG